jgi:hypothetical protein
MKRLMSSYEKAQYFNNTPKESLVLCQNSFGRSEETDRPMRAVAAAVLSESDAAFHQREINPGSFVRAQAH